MESTVKVSIFTVDGEYQEGHIPSGINDTFHSNPSDLHWVELKDNDGNHLKWINMQYATALIHQGEVSSKDWLY
ncbi:hypothetical protein [Nesterenkonia populi]|uniref:hypothetical protein n=1 Tax=Nesterenkonia populi TaxID=1591087 RepID=UPI0011BEE188|nr:hypothetical protein [Nesterenkonia populi]